MHDFILRAPQEGDFAAWSDLWRGYLEFYESEEPLAQYRHAFEHLLSEDPARFQGILAIGEDGPIGLAHYVFHPNIRRPEGSCYLQDLFTDPKARGRGVGRALIEAVSEAAQARGVVEIYWMTQEFNYQGRMLYDRVGMKTPFIKYTKRTVDT